KQARLARILPAARVGGDAVGFASLATQRGQRGLPRDQHHAVVNLRASVLNLADRLTVRAALRLLSRSYPDADNVMGVSIDRERPVTGHGNPFLSDFDSISTSAFLNVIRVSQQPLPSGALLAFESDRSLNEDQIKERAKVAVVERA